MSHDDVPNWFTLLFSLIVWPAFLYWWHTRKVQGVPFFDVVYRPGQIAIGTQLSRQQFDAIYFEFTNKTGSVAYLSRARLRENRKRFPIPIEAAKEISGGWRVLHFQQTGSASFAESECVLQTDKSITTSMAISRPMDTTFFSYRPSWVWLRRRFRRPKYFLLQYSVVVGEKEYSVETVY
jgi:hypothetical protein